VKAVAISDKQKKVLKRLANGWFLDPCGMDGFAGWLWADGKKGFRVSVSDMNTLFSECLIDGPDPWFGFKITEQGRKVVA
jgi:hypothetical protein